LPSGCHGGGRYHRRVAPDDRLIESMEAAVAASPADVPLRLHLAALLADAGEPARALEHVTAALGVEPSNQEAHAAARRLLDSMSAAPAAVTADGPDPGEDEFDAFLREVLEEADVDIERPPVTLEDVGGLDDVKRRLHTSFLGPMTNPKLRKMYGKSLRGGLLLYGPPGCGKTFLARAVAGELSARFFAVGLHDVLDMWLGKSEQNVHNVFETARRHTPCVLFLDEVDALGMKRSNLSHSAGRNVVVQLLSEMDSTRNDNEGVFILGATNQPWDLDPALRRPGRFDRMLLVLPPDMPARQAIVEYHLRDRPVEGVDTAVVARRTDGYSGADLRLLCEAAAERALEESVVTGDARPIGRDDFEAALGEVRPSTRPWFETAKSYAMFANDGGVYDDLLDFMRRHKLA
jgi:SpoVK/Ycf46/Vps4 family AAA+-type ATPase